MFFIFCVFVSPEQLSTFAQYTTLVNTQGYKRKKCHKVERSVKVIDRNVDHLILLEFLSLVHWPTQ